MVDVRLNDGRPVIDSSGNYEVISGDEAELQRAFICLNIKKGSFIYDRELGSELYKLDRNAENLKENAELVLNEALAKFENTYVSVLEAGDVLKVSVSTEAASMQGEVHWH